MTSKCLNFELLKQLNPKIGEAGGSIDGDRNMSVLWGRQVLWHSVLAGDDRLPLDEGRLSPARRRALARQQMILNFLAAAGRHDECAAAARRAHLVEWICAEERRASAANGPKQEDSGAAAAAAAATRCLAAQWDLPRDWVAFGRYPVPSAAAAAALALEAALDGDSLGGLLADNRRQLLLPLLALLRHPKLPVFRQKALRALSGVVAREPTVLAQEGVSRAVCACMRDEARSVRAAAVSLVGSYMCRSPALTQRYYEGVCQLCGDAGTSVRKAAVSILRECLGREGTPRAVAEAACVAVVPLLRDESQVLMLRHPPPFFSLPPSLRPSIHPSSELSLSFAHSFTLAPSHARSLHLSLRSLLTSLSLCLCVDHSLYLSFLNIPRW